MDRRHDAHRATAPAADAAASSEPIAPGKRTLVEHELAPRAAAATATAAAAPLDGLVDPFMKARWNPAPFWALAARHGLPGHAPPDVMGELDRWLPLALSPEARGAIHVGAALVSGAIDDTIWHLAEAMPGLGPIVATIHDIAGVAERIQRYADLGDPGGAAIAAAAGAIHVLHGIGERVAGPIATVAGLAEKLDVAASVIEAGTAAAGPIVVGGIAIKATAHGVSEAIGGVDSAATAVLAGVDGIGRLVDVIEIAYAATRARSCEARARFDHAGEYKDLMQGQAIDVVFGTMKDVIDLGGVVASTLLGPLGWLVPADFLAGQAIGAAGAGVEAIGELTGAVREAIGPAAGGAADVTIPLVDVSLADVLRVDRPYLGPAYPTGDASVDAARGHTVDAAAAAQAAAIAARPEWYAELDAAILATPGFTFATGPDRLRPTWYLEQIARALRLSTTDAAGAAVGGLGAAIDAVGAGLQPALDLAVTGTNRFLATHLPPLQQLAASLDAELQRTRLDLAAARGAVAMLQNLAAVGRQTVPQVAATAAIVRDRMIATLRGMKVALPDGPGLDGIETAINQAIDAACATVTTAYATGIVPLQAAITRLVAEIERELAELQAALAQGGAVHQALDAQYQAIKDLVHRGTELFVRWQPVVARIDVRGGGTWLRDLGARWRTAIAIERGTAPDPWATDIVPHVAAPHVAGWKQVHTGELERAFAPRLVPPAEQSACDQLRGRGLAAIARLPPAEATRAHHELDDAIAACDVMRGQRGRFALDELWRREARLVRSVRGLEARAARTP